MEAEVIMKIAKNPLFILCVVFGLLLSLFGLAYYLDSVLSPIVEDRFADCPDCLNNTTLKEFCNTSNKSPECVHYGWCITLRNIERSTK